MFLEERGGERFSIVFEVSERFAVSVLGVGLESECELSAEVGALCVF
jgi:hypothetical protein